MRVAANLSMFYTDVPLIQRYERAARAGFKLVEVSLPYSEPAEKLRDAADAHGLAHVLINAPTGDWSSGLRGIAALASQRASFSASIDTAIHYARTLRCRKIHFMAGIPKEDDVATAEDTFIHNIYEAAERLGKEGFECLIEPINPITIPGYFLNSYTQARSLLTRIASPNLKIQFDFFHAAQIAGGIPVDIDEWKEKIGHIQIAQSPGRGEPETEGTIDYAKWFAWLKDQKDFDWVIGAEYTPTKHGDEAVEWVQMYELEF